MKKYTAEELAKGSGKEGEPMLVAVGGKVYDVSASKKWIAGEHMKRHKAGEDLTQDIRAAPHDLEVLERFEMVGAYEECLDVPAEGLKGTVDSWLDRHPFFRRHPHPALVHFPMCLFIVAPILHVLAIITGSEATEWAAVCCLGFGVLTLPPVMVTGYFTWWINYDCGQSRNLVTKRRLAWAVAFFAITALVMRLLFVHPLQLGDVWAILYLIDLLILVPLTSLVGFLGGNLVIPYD
jgi:predicted heme/steroid binding protein/uncharacterized membrane protein